MAIGHLFIKSNTNKSFGLLNKFFEKYSKYFIKMVTIVLKKILILKVYLNSNNIVNSFEFNFYQLN